jgi:hypothetical protein
MAMKKSIGRTLAQIDVVANTSVRIHEDFFNSHRIYRQLLVTVAMKSTFSRYFAAICRACYAPQ